MNDKTPSAPDRSRLPAFPRETGVGSFDPVAVRDLGAQLAELQAALEQLSQLAADKLAALSRADAPALQDCAAREGEILQAVFRSEPRRKAALARVAQSLPGAAVEPLRLRNIAARLPEPVASSLRARSTALQALAAELQRKNRLAGRVAQNLQSHIRGIFADVARAAQESQVYGPQGQHETGRPRCWVDALG